jgi:hypothetical protein
VAPHQWTLRAELEENGVHQEVVGGWRRDRRADAAAFVVSQRPVFGLHALTDPLMALGGHTFASCVQLPSLHTSSVHKWSEPVSSAHALPSARGGPVQEKSFAPMPVVVHSRHAVVCEHGSR